MAGGPDKRWGVIWRGDRTQCRGFPDMVSRCKKYYLRAGFKIDFESLMDNKKYTKHQSITEYTTWMIFNRTRTSVYRIRELELAQFGLTVEQSMILSLLSNRGGSATSKTIEDLTMRQHNSISALINRMIKMDLVAKKKNLDNKKAKIFITKYGEDLYKQVPIHSLEMVFSSLKEKERKRLFNYLNILLEKARDLLGISFVPPFLLKPIDAGESRNSDIQEHDEERKPTGFELWMLLNRTRNTIYRLRELELAQFDLTIEQSAILKLLVSRGGITSTKTIQDITMRQHHSISTLINRMIKMDLVAKRKNPVSKKNEILITKQGEDFYNKIPIRSIEMLFCSLKVKDIELLVSYLNVLLEKARDMLGLSDVQLSGDTP
jgi:DNA-binding MarR family transcriptional regulator